MENSNCNGIYIRVAFGMAVGVLFLLLSTSIPTHAQPVLGAQNTALGGGGTAYLSGYEAIYWNPANTAINDRQGTVHIGLGQTGVRYEPVLSSDAIGDQFFNFTDSYYPYQPWAVDITSTQRKTILDENYPRNRLRSQHQTRTDIILGGVSWYRGEETFSLSARARYSSRINVGRGWYSNNFISSNDQEIRDFTLNQHVNQNLEIAFSYGREFTFIEGLFARLNKMYVGISPKFVIAGPHFSASYQGQQISADNSNTEQYISEFSYHSSGSYSQMTRNYISTRDPQSAINNNLDRKLDFSPTGYGGAFDFGLTYLIPLGSELNILENNLDQAVVGKSLRISVSINDIGMIHYNEQPLALSAPADTAQIGNEPLKESMFIGSGGQYLTYFDDTEELPNPFESSNNPNGNNFTTLAPTSLNTGMLLDLKRIKFMGDLTVGFNNNAFTNTKLAMHLGLELRPIEKIPLRAGTRLAAGLPPYVSFGTGIETRYWDFNVGTQLIFRSQTFTTEMVGGAVAGIQLHL